MNADRASALNQRNFPRRLLLIAFIAGYVLIACEKNNQTNLSSQTATQKYEIAALLEGIVSDDHGPVKTGRIIVTDNNDRQVAGATVQDKGQYSVEIPAGTELPVVLSFYPNLSNTTAAKFITAVVYTTITKYDLNPRTTAIAKQAKAMGGYTHANLILAAENAASVPDANKTTAGFRGDPTKQYGGWH